MKTEFEIRTGVPEVRDLINGLIRGNRAGTLDADATALFAKLSKSIRHLAKNPVHPGLASHEIDDLTDRYGQKVFQSYLENRTPAAGRIYWVYGPERKQITIIGIEPHPEDDKRGGYDRVNLSRLPPK